MSEMVLKNLPYAKDALEPYISVETLEFHHGKHQKFCIEVLNQVLPEAELEDKSLSDIIHKTADDDANIDAYQYASQLWNTMFYWRCMTPDGGGEPVDYLAEKIVTHFGSYYNFRESFKKAGLRQFGSGWVWLVADSRGGKLSIMSTDNADTAMVYNKIPILACCVWEHAYYLDYRDRRDNYLENFLDKLVDWEYANALYQGTEKALEGE